MQVYDHLIEDGKLEELIGKVILRIIISIQNMTGGTLGAYGYLNYLKNNIHPDVLLDSDKFIVETKNGKKKVISISELNSSNRE